MKSNIKVINLGFVNAFLVKLKDGFALIDTGVPNSWNALEEKLISEGCKPDKLKIVILTHGDMDHVGNAKKLQDKYKAKILIHKKDFEDLKKGVHTKRFVRPLGFRIMFTIIFALYQLRRKFKKADEHKDLFKPIFVSDGESLAKYGFNAKIIHIPGHSKGSIGILTKDKIFFAGDTFVNRKKPETAQIIENDKELKDSIEKIKRLDIKTIYPGHGTPFSYNSMYKQ